MSQSNPLKVLEEIGKSLDLLKSLNCANADDEATKLNLEKRRAIVRDNIRYQFELIAQNKEQFRQALLPYRDQIHDLRF